MKHIKDKKVFEAVTTNELEDIRDMCLELEDKNYQVYIDKKPFKGCYFIVIRKENIRSEAPEEKYSKFLYKDIEEVVERIKDYMGTKVVSIESFYTGESDVLGHWHSGQINSKIQGLFIKVR